VVRRDTAGGRCAPPPLEHPRTFDGWVPSRIPPGIPIVLVLATGYTRAGPSWSRRTNVKTPVPGGAQHADARCAGMAGQAREADATVKAALRDKGAPTEDHEVFRPAGSTGGARYSVSGASADAGARCLCAGFSRLLAGRSRSGLQVFAAAGRGHHGAGRPGPE